MSTPDLTVIIPVHNAAETIESVVADFRRIDDLSIQIILVDDCSADGSTEIVDRLAAENENTIARHHRVNRGAGVARNTGFPDATGRYTLFFDADDHIHGDALVTAVQVLDETDASVAILSYRYRRGTGQHEDMNTVDLDVFDEYLGSRPQRVARLDDMPRLLGISNYPWNKVLRTRTYRQAGIRFGSTPVHNDILGHWYSVAFASSIALINEPVCTHVVAEGGSNLTNRQSAVRLTLFDALDETYDLIESNPDIRYRYSHHYWASVIRVGTWAQTRITPAHLDEFNVRFQQHLLRINLADYARIRMKRDPALANAIQRKSLA